MSLLDSLPPGAVFSARQGSSAVQVATRQPPDGAPREIIITATCDSLKQVIRSLEEELSTRQDKAVYLAQEEQRTHASIPVAKWLAMALLLGGIAGFCLRKKLFE